MPPTNAPGRNDAARDGGSTPPLQSPSENRKSKIAAYRVLWILGVAVFVLDQPTKLWIIARLPYGTYGEAAGAIPVVRGFFYLVHVGNTGAAWSMLTGQSVFLAVPAAATLVAIACWRRALGLRERIPQICFGLLCGGILGNL